MATKQQLIDTYYQQMRRTHPDLMLHRKLIEQNMARAWNQILHDAFSKQLSYLDFYAKDYQSETVNLDAVTKQYYTTLPVAIVQLPDKSEGVRTVKPGDQSFLTPTGTGVKFVPISEQDMRYKTNLDVGLSENSLIGYTVRYDTIWYDSNMDATQAAKKVHLELVVPFDIYTGTETVPVPSGKDEQLYLLTTQFILGTVPQTR
jgi:hypothetical protein